MCGMPVPEHGVAFVGVGATAATRAAIGSDTDMAIAACRAAAEDAGVDVADIDGINVQVHHYPTPDTAGIAKALGMREVNWSHDGGLGIPSVALAAQVLESGRAKTVVVCKVMNTGASIATPQIDAGTGGVEGPTQFEVPYG